MKEGEIGISLAYVFHYWLEIHPPTSDKTSARKNVRWLVQCSVFMLKL